MNQNIQPTLFPDQSPTPPGVDNEISLLALADLQGVGFVTIRALFDAYKGDLTAVWGASPDELQEHLHLARIPQQELVARQIKGHSKRLFEHAREQAKFLKTRRRTSILFKGTPEYPQGLKDLDEPPAWLFVEGDVNVLYDPAIIAVIGTRTPSKVGLEAAKRASVSLARAGYVILSGLAEGIDAVGHKTAVDYGAPTIAVLGHGIDVVFPAATASLRQQIVEQGGAVVSEYLPKDSYSRDRFVSRNRIQAALSKAVIVAEGKVRSGTAHTVRFARQLERKVIGVQVGESPIPHQQNLLEELKKQGDYVFDLGTPDDRDKLRGFLMKVLPVEGSSHRKVSPRLFLTLMSEIERLARDYDAQPEDFEWLVGQIQVLSSFKGSQDANQGDHS